MNEFLNEIPIAAARLIQIGLREEGFYKGTTKGRPAAKTHRAYELYEASLKEAISEPIKSGEPRWLEQAKKYDGLREIVGPRHNSKILGWFERIGLGWINDDETPWCAAFVGGVLKECGIDAPKSAAARSFLKWGVETKPRIGAVVVFWRGSIGGWKGHVGFVVAMSESGDPIVIGGNQGNAVNIKRFDQDRVLGYRWPKDEALSPEVILAHEEDYEISTNEA